MPHVIQSFLLDGRGRFATAARRSDVPVAEASGGRTAVMAGARRLRRDGVVSQVIPHESFGRYTTTGWTHHPSLDTHTDTALRASERLGKER